RGLALFLSRRMEEAEREFKAAIEADPSLPEARYYYARACFQQGRNAEAARLCREANAAREGYQAAFFAAQAGEASGGHAVALEDYRLALDVCERHMEMNPDDPRAATMRAVCLARLGRREEGIQWARQALAIDPLDAGVRYNVACLYAVEGATDDATPTCRPCAAWPGSRRCWTACRQLRRTQPPPSLREHEGHGQPGQPASMTGNLQHPPSSPPVKFGVVTPA
ncbi:MAG: tetratricopeptide repeat protein, partial [Deltaproteobacteria bacterium]|nr:tetratricopeptide repeat protein [Deltaproteobacteria bacterium]